MDPVTGKPANKQAQPNGAMKDDTLAGQAVEQQSVEEPSDSRCRKHKFIDWGRFDRMYGNRAEVGEKNETVPMTRRVFGCLARDTQGEDADSITDWWAELEEDPAIERDNLRRRG